MSTVALLLHGVEIDKGHPLVISTLDENSQVAPIYVKLFNIAPKSQSLMCEFSVVTRIRPSAYVPLMDIPNKKSGKQSKGYAFVYLKSLDDFKAALRLNQTCISCKKVTVVRGLFRA
ncbi:hypothetical protein Tco_0110296 [Tanacetum coccineum]